jgi:hypothetical protein
MNNVYVSLLLALVLISASRALAKPPIIILPCEHCDCEQAAPEQLRRPQMDLHAIRYASTA